MTYRYDCAICSTDVYKHKPDYSSVICILCIQPYYDLMRWYRDLEAFDRALEKLQERKKYRHEYYLANKEKIQEWNKKWWAENIKGKKCSKENCNIPCYTRMYCRSHYLELKDTRN